MGRMKNYYDYSQWLCELEDETLRLMLELESDEYKRKLIEWELEDRAKA